MLIVSDGVNRKASRLSLPGQRQSRPFPDSLALCLRLRKNSRTTSSTSEVETGHPCLRRRRWVAHPRPRSSTRISRGPPEDHLGDLPLCHPRFPARHPSTTPPRTPQGWGPRSPGTSNNRFIMCGHICCTSFYFCIHHQIWPMSIFKRKNIRI